jgi:hypothetical protein
MTKRTRYFVLGSGAILVLGFTTGLVASFVGLPAVFSRSAGPDELQYVPADAAVVAYANVREVMGSDFRQRFRKLEPNTRERDEFEQKTGVNIEQDIDSVVTAMLVNAEGATSGHPEEGVVILARGRFQPARLESLTLEHGGRVEEYQGKRLLTHPDGRQPGKAMALGFIDADLVAIGSADSVRRAIDANRSGNTVTSNTQIMQQVAELDGNSAWAVGRFDALAREARLPVEVQSHVPPVNWFSAAGRVNGDVSVQAKAEARDEEAGQNLRDMLRGFMAMAKLQANSKPGMKQLVDSLQLTGEGKIVAIQFALPTELLDALEGMGRHRGAADNPNPQR